jgi:hypothetical protein
VDYYEVDYVALRKSFYNAEGDVVVTSVPMKGCRRLPLNSMSLTGPAAAISTPSGFLAPGPSETNF